jgi:hypothetical protein
VKCAHDDVKGEPSAINYRAQSWAHEQKDSADDNDYPNNGDKNDPVGRAVFPKVIEEAC